MLKKLLLHTVKVSIRHKRQEDKLYRPEKLILSGMTIRTELLDKTANRTIGIKILSPCLFLSANGCFRVGKSNSKNGCH